VVMYKVRRFEGLEQKFCKCSETHKLVGASGSVVVKALRYKPEGGGFETRSGEWIFLNVANPSGRTRPWGLLSL
jgi:hypothetical protein